VQPDATSADAITNATDVGRRATIVAMANVHNEGRAPLLRAPLSIGLLGATPQLPQPNFECENRILGHNAWDASLTIRKMRFGFYPPVTTDLHSDQRVLDRGERLPLPENAHEIDELPFVVARDHFLRPGHNRVATVNWDFVTFIEVGA
jgi:hypothetical protein